MSEPLGLLVPVGGGDAIPLAFEVMTVGRRSTCDIRLDFQNVSAMHCELSFRGGIWHVRDMGSTNGIKVNGAKTPAQVLAPGAELDISKHKYKVVYSLPEGVALDELPAEEDDIFGKSLMEKAGLEKPKTDRGRRGTRTG